MIPDSFGGLFARFAEPLTRRSEPAEPTAAIDQTDVQVAEANDMVAGLSSAMPTSSPTRASLMKIVRPST